MNATGRPAWNTMLWWATSLLVFPAASQTSISFTTT